MVYIRYGLARWLPIHQDDAAVLLGLELEKGTAIVT